VTSGAGAGGSAEAGLLPVVTAQRDRLKKQVLGLEERLHSAQQLAETRGGRLAALERERDELARRTGGPSSGAAGSAGSGGGGEYGRGGDYSSGLSSRRGAGGGGSLYGRLQQPDGLGHSAQLQRRVVDMAVRPQPHIILSLRATCEPGRAQDGFGRFGASLLLHNRTARLVVVGYLALLHLLVWFSIHRLQSCVVARSCARNHPFFVFRMQPPCPSAE